MKSLSLKKLLAAVTISSAALSSSYAAEKDAQTQVAAAPTTPAAAKKSTHVFKNDSEKASYIIGHQIAKSITSDPNIKVDKEMLVRALKDGLNGKESDISQQESQEFMQKYIAAQQKVAGEKNKKEGEAFLEKNKKAADVVTLPSGLQYKVITAGKGAKPKATDTVTVDYEGTLVDGKVFDSSYKRGQPVSFPVNGVIKGWTEALQLMPEGSTWMLYVPSGLAYGAMSPSPLIGPNSTLVFKVHFISIAKPAPAPAAPKAEDKNKKAEDKNKMTEDKNKKADAK